MRVDLFLEVRSVAPLTGSLVPGSLEEGSGKWTEMEYRIAKNFRWCKILQKWLFDYLAYLALALDLLNQALSEPV